MLDSKYLRQDVEQTAARLAARGYELDVAKVTELEEQRKTDWMENESLIDFLDPNDTSKTIEGYPAPLRAILTAKA